MSINKFLKELSTGDTVRDYSHASKTFVSDTFAMQPRHKHLFHVVFNFTPDAISAMDYKYDAQHNLHFLVKNVDLPKFEIEVDNRNQYNRHRYTQHKINYEPVNLTFHDDQSDTIRKLWHDYYKFYYQDGQFGDGASTYTTNDVYTERNDKNIPWGMDRGPLGLKHQYFSHISIFSMYQKKFMEHRLINPIIRSFGHDRHDYASGELMEHTMQIQYETVLYGEGIVNQDNPANFAVDHYDHTPSPITPLGGGTNSIFKNGGLIDGANSVFNMLGKGNILGAIIAGKNTIENGKDMNIKRVLKDEGLGVLNNVLRGKAPFANTVFPTVFSSEPKSKGSWSNPDATTGSTNTASSQNQPVNTKRGGPGQLPPYQRAKQLNNKPSGVNIGNAKTPPPPTRQLVESRRDNSNPNYVLQRYSDGSVTSVYTPLTNTEGSF